MTDDAETIRALTERKVYVVIDDDGESIKVAGVFSKAEDAEAMKAITPYSDVAPMTLDEFAEVARRGLSLWRVEWFSPNDPSASQDHPARDAWRVASGVEQITETWSGRYTDGLMVYVWAKDEESATAKGVEMFRKFKEQADAD